ncbi:MAG: DUF1579 domain-containing protein [Steroidobacteraceae bacterium]
MTEQPHLQTRRDVIIVALAVAAAVSAGVAVANEPRLTGHEHDWDWLVGSWKVRHRRLKGRLVGSTEWEEFNGTSVLWLTLGGLGTIDDNVLELPGGTYRACGLRAFDPKSGQWSIWWLDGRNPTVLDPPVRGGFKDGTGVFVGDDTLNGRPIKMRFRWTAITPTSAHWDQAFSPDGGATWETNWHMDFTRVTGA